jgi:hypothetical protein
MNPQYFIDIFLKLAFLEDELAKLNLSQDIIDFINSSPNHIKPLLLSKIKKNYPNVSINLLTQWKQEIISNIDRKQKLKESSMDPDVFDIANTISNPNIIHWWINIINKKQKFLESLKKNNSFNKQELIDNLKLIEHFYLELPENKTYSYNNQNITVDLGQISFQDLLTLAKHWEHKIQSGPTATVTINSDNIVFTFPNDYFIIELKTEPELQLEGKLLSHCVGGYFHQIENGESRIFSLRTSSNVPLVTIETDSNMFQFRQMFGRNNSQPNAEQMEYINLWKQSLHPKDKVISLVESDNIQDKINAILFMNYNDPEYAKIIDSIIAKAKPSTKEFIQEGYTENNPKSELQALAQNTTLPENLYEIIYQKDINSISTKYGLITNNSIGEDLFKKLLTETNPVIVQACLSSRKIANYPEYIIKKAKNADNLSVILNNPSISSSITRKLIVQYSPTYLFENDNLEPKFINDWVEVFKNDPDKVVFALKSKNIRKEDLITIAKELGISINLTDSESEIVNKIYASGSPVLLNIVDTKILATNPDLPIDIMQKLLEDKDWNVRKNLASNPKIPIEIMQKLLEYEDYYVRGNLALNPKLPIEIMQKLSEDKNYYIKYNLALNPKLPIEIMQKLLEDKDWNIRKNLANNPNLPIEIMQKLLEDERAGVRTTIRDNIYIRSLVNKKNAN